VDGQAGKRAKFGGEGLRFCGLGAELAGEVDGVANYDTDDAKAAAEAGNGTEIISLTVTPFQREDRLGGQAQLVGDGYPDAAVADVQAEMAGGGFQLLAPQVYLPAYCG
jgi:hypothetical protein